MFKAKKKNTTCGFYYVLSIYKSVSGLKEQCDLNGMSCLNDNYNELAVLKTPWSKRTGLVCNCMPSCSETEMFLIKDEKSG